MTVQVVERGTTGRRVRICGEVDLATVGALRDALAAVVELPAPGERLVIDAAGVGFLSAGGARVLLRFAERLRSNGAGLVIDAASPLVQRVLRLCGYSGVLGPSLRGERSAGPASACCPVGLRRASRGLDGRTVGGGALSSGTPSPHLLRCSGSR